MQAKTNFCQLVNISYNNATEFKQWLADNGYELTGSLSKSSTWENLSKQFEKKSASVDNEQSESVKDKVADTNLVNIAAKNKFAQLAGIKELSDLVDECAKQLRRNNYVIKGSLTDKDTWEALELQYPDVVKQEKKEQERQRHILAKHSLSSKDKETIAIREIAEQVSSNYLLVNGQRYPLTNDKYQLLVKHIEQLETNNKLSERVGYSLSNIPLTNIASIEIETLGIGAIRKFPAMKTRTGQFVNSTGLTYESSIKDNYNGECQDLADPFHDDFVVTDKDNNFVRYRVEKYKSIKVRLKSGNDLLVYREYAELSKCDLDSLHSRLTNQLLKNTSDKPFIPMNSSGNRVKVKRGLLINLSDFPTLSKRLQHFSGLRKNQTQTNEFSYEFSGGVVTLTCQYTPYYKESIPVAKVIAKNVVKYGWVDRTQLSLATELKNISKLGLAKLPKDYSKSDFTSTFNLLSNVLPMSVIEILRSSETIDYLNTLFTWYGAEIKWNFKIQEHNLIAYNQLDDSIQVILASKVVKAKQKKLEIIPLQTGNVLIGNAVLLTQSEVVKVTRLISTTLVKHLSNFVTDINQQHNKDLDKNLRRTIKYCLVNSDIYQLKLDNLNVPGLNLSNKVSLPNQLDKLKTKANAASIDLLKKYISDQLAHPQLITMIKNISNSLVQMHGQELALSYALEIKQLVKSGKYSSTEILAKLTENKYLAHKLEKQHQRLVTNVVADTQQGISASESFTDESVSLRDSILANFK